MNTQKSFTYNNKHEKATIIVDYKLKSEKNTKQTIIHEYQNATADRLKERLSELLTVQTDAIDYIIPVKTFPHAQ